MYDVTTAAIGYGTHIAHYRPVWTESRCATFQFTENSCKPLSVQLLLEMSSTNSNLVSTIAEKYTLVLHQLLLSSLHQNRPRLNMYDVWIGFMY